MERQTWAGFPFIRGNIKDKLIVCIGYGHCLSSVIFWVVHAIMDQSSVCLLTWIASIINIVSFLFLCSVQIPLFLWWWMWHRPFFLMFYFCQPYLLTDTCSSVSSTYSILFCTELLSVCTDSIYIEHNHYALSIIHHKKASISIFPIFVLIMITLSLISVKETTVVYPIIFQT